MKFAVGKADITPDAPVFMAGFGARTGKSEGVLDELYAKALYISPGSDPDLVILTFDMLGGDRSFVNGLKAVLTERFGLQAERILINFSHTHAGVYMTGADPADRRGGYSMGQERWPERSDEIDYSADLRADVKVKQQVVDLIDACAGSLKDGTIELGIGSSRIAVNRRLPTEGGIRFMPHFAGDVDPDLPVFRVRDGDGATLALLFAYACHPTSMGPDNRRLSAEFVGRACDRLERAVPGAVALYMQGCAAELKPTFTVEGGRFRACTPEQMIEGGDALAEDVLRVLDTALFARLEGPFLARMSSMRLPLEPKSPEEYERLLEQPGQPEYNRRALSRLVASIRDGTVKDGIPLYVSVWHMGRDTRLIAIEGEVSVRYALLLKKLFPGGRTVVLGYSNGVPTYIPSARVLREGGYEAEAYRMHGMAGPLRTEIEDMIVGRIVLDDLALRD